MGIFDRISRVIRANVNDMIDKAEDPEKVLEQSIREMGDDLVKMRQAVAQAIASQKNRTTVPEKSKRSQYMATKSAISFIKRRRGFSKRSVSEKENPC